MELNLKENRLFQVAIALIVSFTILFVATNIYLGKKKAVVLRKRAEFESFSKLRVEYEGISGVINPFDLRAAATGRNLKTERILGDIGEALGIKKKMGSFRAFAAGAVKGYMKNATELTLTGITLNELVNFLYRVDGHRNMLMVKGFSMKPSVTSNDNSGGELLDVVLSVEIISKGRG